MIIAAPIAATLAIFGVVVTRGTKITEFRQAWINDQRRDIADLVAAANRSATLSDPDKRSDAIAAFDAASARIRMRRNPNRKLWHKLRGMEPEWADALRSLAKLEKAALASPVDAAKIRSIGTAMVEQSVPHLKKEWNRTRRGELGFRIYIATAPFLIGGTLTLAVGWLFAKALGLAWIDGVELQTLLPIDLSTGG